MADFEFGLSLEEPVEPTSETAEDGVYAHVANHVELAISRLIQTFREGPRTQVELSAYADEIQELEDAIFDLFNAFDVDTAEGEQLDFIGRIVGESRADRGDDDYRAAVRVRQLINRSNGTFDEIVAIAEAIYPDGNPEVRELYPASMMVEYEDLGSLTFDHIYLLLQQAKAGGVRLGVSTGFEPGEGSSIGDDDGDPAGGVIGDDDGDPAGFVIANSA